MTSTGRRYTTSAAFVQALNHELRIAADATGRPVEELRRQFLTHRFLARVFHTPSSGWVLLGGVGLLVRVPEARATQDVDLLHTTSTVDEAVHELDALLATPELDPLTFQRAAPRRMVGRTLGARISVTARAGPTTVGTFPIDLTVHRTTVARTQLIRPQPVIEMDGVGPLPEFTLYPVEDQVADKVCTMYERYGPRRSPSTRYHDLVDLVLIARECSMEATQTRLAIDAEQERRGLTVPATLASPDPTWTTAYPVSARRSSLPPHLHDVDVALSTVRTFLGPLLTNSVRAGRWNPDDHTWV
jgi:hypothetical protein